MIKFELAPGGLAFSLSEGVCKAAESDYAMIADGFTRSFEFAIESGGIDLHADIDLQLVESLKNDFPRLVVDTTNHEPLERDTGDGDRVF